MKPLTDATKQWLWFAVLWVAGMAGVALMAYGTRWLLGI